MNTERDYELHVLKYAIDRTIDNLLPRNSQEALNAIANQNDEIVWRIATEIYTKSGH